MEPGAHDTSEANDTAGRSEQRAARSEARQVRQQQQSGNVYRLLWSYRGWGIAVLVGVLIAGVTIWVVRMQPRASASEIAGIVTYQNLSRTHVSGNVIYPQTPPVGGPHNPVWQNCGMYSSPLANEHAVHSMEHGAVWITYQPQLNSQAIEQLRALVRGHTYVLLSPYPGLPSTVVASAWGVQLRVTSASDPRLAQFLKTYEQGPQTPEPGAPCRGGMGTPDKQ